MRARLQRFLPLILLALAMQVMTPIAACWAAAAAVADPLQNVPICHASGEQPDNQSGGPNAHAGGCAVCCLVQASASFDAPRYAFIVVPRSAKPVVWRDAIDDAVVMFGGSNTRARAPPFLS